MNPGEATSARFAPRVPRSGRIVIALLGRLRHGRLDLAVPGGQVFSFAGDLPGPDAAIELRDWGVLDDVLRSGDVGFAETYLDGRWSTPDLRNLLALLAANRAAIDRALYGKWWGRLYYRLRHLLRANTRNGAKKNIHEHYDLGNEFYAAWLDRTMTYSAALFGNEPDRSLEEAQAAKYERILQRLGAGPHSTILEIGCGWGGFAEYAARTRGCRVRGVTLSVEQLRFARHRISEAGLDGRVELSLTDYRDIEGQFDHVVSVEMFEAVGERYWPTYFNAVRDRLKPGGRALVQTITIADELFARYRRSTDFIQQYIFPGGMLPCRGVFAKLAGRAGLTVRNEFLFGRDYAETLARWRAAYGKRAADLRRLGFDERFERLWTFYLTYCEVGFRVGSTDVMQVELQRD